MRASDYEKKMDVRGRRKMLRAGEETDGKKEQQSDHHIANNSFNVLTNLLQMNEKINVTFC